MLFSWPLFSRAGLSCRSVVAACATQLAKQNVGGGSLRLSPSQAPGSVTSVEPDQENTVTWLGLPLLQTAPLPSRWL